MRLLALSSFCLALACGSLKGRFASDGGADGATGGGDSGLDAGSSRGDGGGVDGGGVDAGPPVLTWSQLAGPTPPISGFFAGIGGYRDASGLTLYASVDQRIARFNAGGWTIVYNDPGSHFITPIYVSPGGSVYAGGDSTLAYCPSACTATGSFSITTIAQSVRGLCSSDGGVVYAAGFDYQLAHQGALYGVNAYSTTWVAHSTNTGTQDNAGCWVEPSGVVDVAVFTGVLRYDPSLTSFSPEGLGTVPLGFPAQGTNENLYAVWGDGARLFAVGEYRYVVQRNAQGGWDALTWDSSTTQTGGKLLAVAPLGARAFALGDVGVWNMVDYAPDSGWVADMNGPPGNILGAWTDDATGRIYAAGDDGNGTAAIWVGQP